MSQARSKAAKKAAEKPAADETKTDETSATEAEKPTGTAPVEEASADGAKANDSTLAAPATGADTTEDPADAVEKQAAADADDSTDADGDGEQPAATTPPAPAPKSAQIDPPEDKTNEDEGPQERYGQTDAAAERVSASEHHFTITDAEDNPVDPDEVFTDADANGQRRCKLELIEHSHQTVFARAVRTLLLPKGARISDAGAERIIARIRAERA